MEKQLSKYIDHTNLKPEATNEDVKRLCEEAKEYGFASVCVNSVYAKLASECLEGTDIKTCVVVGFPLGAMSSAAKAFETRQAVADGAEEIDMVIAVGALKEGNLDYVIADIASVVEAAGEAIVKVIIEACLLTDEEKVIACYLAKKAGAAFVKTSTGFGKGGATVEDVALMRRTVGEELGVKAAGGIHTKAEALAMIKAGANRIGASAGIRIVSEE